MRLWMAADTRRRTGTTSLLAPHHGYLPEDGHYQRLLAPHYLTTRTGTTSASWHPTISGVKIGQLWIYFNLQGRALPALAGTPLLEYKDGHYQRLLAPHNYWFQYWLFLGSAGRLLLYSALMYYIAA